MANPYFSRYRELWNRLKQDKSITIVALPAKHRTIIKAVTDKKDHDLAFKFECSELGFNYILTHSINKEDNTITFKLTKNKITIEDI